MTRAFALTEHGVNPTKRAAHFGRPRATSGRWLKGVSPYGRSGVRARHPPAQNGPRRVRHGPAMCTRLMGERRVRAHACCGPTIAYCREREEQARLSVPKLYARLAEQYVLRSTWRTTQTRGAVPKAACARAVIPMDPVAGGHRVACTGLALYTQDAAVVLRPPPDP